MGYHDQAAAPALQVILQPGCHGVIQMVRRLIQHQNITWLHQDLCQSQTFSLTAGKLGYFLIQPDNAKGLKHAFCFSFHIPLCTLRHFFLHMLPDGAGVIKFRCLWQKADHHMICFRAASLIRLFQSRSDF